MLLRAQTQGRGQICEGSTSRVSYEKRIVQELTAQHAHDLETWSRVGGLVESKIAPPAVVEALVSLRASNCVGEVRTAMSYRTTRGAHLCRGDMVLFDPAHERSLGEIWFHAEFSDWPEQWTVLNLHEAVRSTLYFGQFRLKNSGPILVRARDILCACIYRRSSSDDGVTVIWPWLYRQRLRASE